MRKPRDYDADLKALELKPKELKTRKVQQLGQLVIATGAGDLNSEELAGALIMLAETTDTVKKGGLGETRGRVLSAPVTATCESDWSRHKRYSDAIWRRAIGIRPPGRVMICAAGRSNAANAHGTSLNSEGSSSRPGSLI